jgi:hypothetical protein
LFYTQHIWLVSGENCTMEKTWVWDKWFKKGRNLLDQIKEINIIASWSIGFYTWNLSKRAMHTNEKKMGRICKGVWVVFGECMWV